MQKKKHKHSKKHAQGSDISSPEAAQLADTPATAPKPTYGEAKPYDIRDRDVNARGGFDPRYEREVIN